MKAGTCRCGCGQKTQIAPETRPHRGWIRGEPKPYISHHGKFRSASRDGKSKRCNSCRDVKSIDDFHRDRTSADGRQAMCKICGGRHARKYRRGKGAGRVALLRRRWNLKRYGLTIESYTALHDEQGGRCALCNKHENVRVGRTIRVLAIDHDHTTGKVRSLLCMRCNNGIGYFGDDPEILDRAAAYIRKHRS